MMNSQLRNQVQRVGAMSAAIAGLSPLAFDPNHPLQISASTGMYQRKQATAIGLFYQKNEKWMLNASISFGAGEAMGQVGATIRVGHGGSKKMMVRQDDWNELQENIATMRAELEALKRLVRA